MITVSALVSTYNGCNPLRPVEGTETADAPKARYVLGVDFARCNPLRPVEGTETYYRA